MHLRRPLAALAAVLALTACDTHRSAGADPPPPASSSRALVPPVPPDADYRSAVEDRVAAALHSTTSQLATQLKADERLTLMNLAKPAGIAQDKLVAAISSALKDAADAAARPGRWTAEQANQEKQFWTAQSDPDLISELSRWFRQS